MSVNNFIGWFGLVGWYRKELSLIRVVNSKVYFVIKISYEKRIIKLYRRKLKKIYKRFYVEYKINKISSIFLRCLKLCWSYKEKDFWEYKVYFLL